MKDSFAEFYRPTNDEFDRLWSDGRIVLDTNVLLNLYRYPKGAREDLMGLLRSQSGRLWLPYQVALEYQYLRLTVIAEQVSKYSDVRATLTSLKTDLGNELDQLQLTKRHSAIDPSPVQTRVNDAVDEFLRELTELEESHPNVQAHDTIRDELNTLFADRIGPPPEDQQALDVLYDEARERYQQLCPPGYMDAQGTHDKGESAYFNNRGLRYERRYGDYILWRQLLDAAKDDASFKYLMFVTDDSKEDWWWIVKSGGPKTIGPRPELVEEIRRHADVEVFYMYNSERFLSFAKDRLNIPVESQSIEQVREVARRSTAVRHRTFRARAHSAEIAVARWLAETFSGCDVDSQHRGFPDLLVSYPGDPSKIGFSVRLVSHPASVRRYLEEARYRAHYEMNRGALDGYGLVFVAESAEDVQGIASLAAKYAGGDPAIGCVVGWLSEVDSEAELMDAVIVSEEGLWGSES